MLDLCAGPGGKSLAILQTLLPAHLTCNDISRERLQRLVGVLDQYLGPGRERDRLTLSRSCKPHQNTPYSLSVALLLNGAVILHTGGTGPS